MLASTGKARLDLVISSILADRIYGMLSIGVVALPGAAAMFFQVDGSNAAWGLIAVSILGLALIPLLPWLFAVAISVADFVQSRYVQRSAARIARGIRDTISGLADCFNGLPTVAPSFLLSILVHVLAILSTWALGVSMAIDISPLAYFAIVPAVWIATILPVTIGGLGVREASFAVLFSLFGADPEQGIVIGAAVSATGIFAILLSGGILFFIPSDPAQ